MISMDCPKCGHEMHLDEGFLGGVCRCSSCGAMSTVPAELGDRVRAASDTVLASSASAELSDTASSVMTASQRLRRSGLKTSSQSSLWIAGGVGAGLLALMLAVILSSRSESDRPDPIAPPASIAATFEAPTLDQYRAAIPDADERFLIIQMNKAYTLRQAKLNWEYERSRRASGEPSEPVPTTTPKNLHIIVDDAEAHKEGSWISSTSSKPYIGTGYVHDEHKDAGKKSIAFTPDLPEDGLYDVQLSYTASGNRATAVPVIIQHAFGMKTQIINQQKTPAIAGQFHSLGRFGFYSGRHGSVTLRNDQANGHVIADAVTFTRVGPMPAAPPHPDGLLARWSFDERPADGAEFSAILQGSEFGAGSPAGGRTLRLNKDRASAQLGLVPTGDQFTVMAWIQVDPSASHIQTVVANGPGNHISDGWKLFINTSDEPKSRRLVFECGNGTQGGKASSPIHVVDFGRWVHVAAAVDRVDKTAQLFVDGRESSERMNIVGDFAAQAPMRAGTMTDIKHGFRGEIDDIRLYDHAMTADQIKKLIPVKETAQTIWRFDSLTSVDGRWPIALHQGADCVPSSSGGPASGALDLTRPGAWAMTSGVSRSYEYATTLAFWFRPDPKKYGPTLDAEDPTVVMIGDDNGKARPEIIFNPNKKGCMVLRVQIDGQDIGLPTQTRQWPTDQWHHLAFTWDGTTLRLFVNGSLEAEKQQPGRFTTTGTGIGLGSRDSGKMPFRGWIGDLRIMDQCISPTLIQAMHAR